MVDCADIDRPAAHGILRMTAQAEVWIRVGEHFPIHGPVRGVADRAAFAQGFMFEHNRPGLFPMAHRATFVEPRHFQPAGGLENVAPMRVVALRAIHMALDDRVMLRQAEFSARLDVALETRGRVLAGIHDEPVAAAADFDVFAAGTVAGLAAILPRGGRAIHMNSSVRTRGKAADVIGVAIRTGLVPHKMGARDFRRSDDGVRDRGTRIDEEHRAGDGGTAQGEGRCLL